MYCKECGNYTKGKRLTKGSIIIELFLWLLFIIPGLIYSCYRAGSAETVCAYCGSNRLIPEDSPILEEFGRSQKEY